MITLQSVSKSFGSFTAVDEVSLQVERGEIFGLLGGNGAGKTTLIKMMCGVLKPTAGRGEVLGWDIQHEQSNIRPHIGYMSQKFSLYKDLTVQENLLFYARLYGVKGKVSSLVDEQMIQYEVAHMRHKKVGELADGSKQRVAFACAVIHRPVLLFLDEPSSGVDPLTRRLFWEHVYQLTEAGTTMIITTHYMDEAEQCDRLGLMNQGRMVAMGRLEELRQHYSGKGKIAKAMPSLEEMFVYVMEHEGINER
ncbi:ABC transporter ATP-binding protein [Mechercharimyces sp. CAU 1602]|uniref:ABC transporter ATP-binding protein n=1 Tax=Mechercharimyces sp. CAU 1602 TaxID=2973933 RepID=UPI002161ED6B|nr:ABC transporter ATP-binding protein [Mechercharimyces sp. CAU 1602]MCS1350535.1 ABC transporter ATP-binding protein [Mechercharimyces sp. CAU 1602]